MKYLKTIILNNFQSHKHTVLDFNEGLNVVIGPSDTGKSAIIRAIKWVLYNEPSGDYFIRQGENEVSVTLIFSDNTKIKRYRSKSKNQYILYDNLGEEIKYEGFGLGVPEEIIEKIGIEKIYLDSEESNLINLGEQLEGPFLLSEKTSTRASAIGRLIGVNIIDDALKETLRDLRNSSIQKKNKDSHISSLKEELESFEYLKGLNLKLTQLEEIKRKIKIKNEKKDSLIKLSSKYMENKEEIKLLNIYLVKFDNVDNLEINIKIIEDLNKNYKYLKNKKNIFQYCKSEIEKSLIIIDRLKPINRLIEIQDYLFIVVGLRSKLSKLNSVFLLTNSNKENLNNTMLKLKDTEIVESKINNLNNKINNLNDLKPFKDKYMSNLNSIKKGKLYIKRFENLYLVHNYHKDLEKHIINLKVLHDKKKIIDKYKEDLSNEKDRYKNISLQMEKSLNKYQELLENQEICPLCLSNLDDDKISHIMEHFK